MADEPQLLKGMRDFLPPTMILRQHVVNQFRDTFERFGFEPLDTPAIEYAEVLEGKYGDEADKLLYKFEDRGGRRVGLRYDLTVPLARVVAMHPDLVKPFKRYQIAPVWRAEKPQKGRYREFWQCDVDIVGSASALADAEVVNVGYAALRRMGFSRFKTKINDRKILFALAEYSGVPGNQATSVYRAIDKLEKIGVAGVRDELAGAGVEPEVADRLLSLLEISGDSQTILSALDHELAEFPRGRGGVAELREVVDYLQGLGVPSDFFAVDLSMVRGLDYYTGPIFETVVEEPKIGSISGGGRYDRLVGLFTRRDSPATGISLGLERIVDVLEELQMAGSLIGRTVTRVLVTIFSQETAQAGLQLSRQLREVGVNTEVYLGADRLGAQLRYASRKGIPWAVIIGPDEIAGDTVVVKNLGTEEQKTIRRDDALQFFRSQC
ncbi:MAG: histidine--tRNA ligase [Chloroflexi bacterium]|nr:histidine--tRNA ligase [Chloroflexota bacterium]